MVAVASPREPPGERSSWGGRVEFPDRLRDGLLSPTTLSYYSNERYKCEAMRFDRYDIAPFSVVLLFEFLIPLAVVFGVGTRQQIVQDLRQIVIALGLTFGSLLVVIVTLTYWWRSRGRRLERQLVHERGEQMVSEFSALFESSAERRVAQLLYPQLQSFTVSGHVPLRQQDWLFDSPLYADEEDVDQFVIQLCSELDVCPAVNPDVEERLSNAKTVGQLVKSLAELVQRQQNS